MEKFIKVDDEPGILINKHQITLPTGKVFEIGLHKVMFGVRVRGGYAGDMVYLYDWCCGDNKILMYMSQKLLMNMIEAGADLNTIPGFSDIKPWVNDDAFIDKLSQVSKMPLLRDMIEVIKIGNTDPLERAQG